MRYCSNCKRVNPEDSLRCLRCGRNLRLDEPSEVPVKGAELLGAGTPVGEAAKATSVEGSIKIRCFHHGLIQISADIIPENVRCPFCKDA